MIINNLWDFISPVPCAICGGQYSRNDGYICPLCKQKLVINITKSDPSKFLSDRYFYFDLIIALYDYNYQVKPLVLSFKDDDRIYLADFFANTAYNRAIKWLDVDIITAVPLSRSKKASRGYNQSEILAKAISKLSGTLYQPLLLCRGKKGVQKKMNYSGRFLNNIGRYKMLKNRDCHGKKILLVDDVVTTGATLNECARIIKKMGADSVFSLTIARVNI